MTLPANKLAGELNAAGSNTPLRVERAWPASLTLVFAPRGERTAVVRARHKGPLRIQRPFYPENDWAHIYLLHPPGGLVVGDQLQLSLTTEPDARALITTPSAGKIYSLQALKHSDKSTTQGQRVYLQLAAGSSMEWLPQETIVFDGANARLHTQVDAEPDSQFCLWDIVCLGRPACDELFTQGEVLQTLEINCAGKPLLRERTRVCGSDPMMYAPWGLQGASAFGTLVANVAVSRDMVDQLLVDLHQRFSGTSEQWGITQKQGLLIARYLGRSAAQCRMGFAQIWAALRPPLMGREAIEPRIWNT